MAVTSVQVQNIIKGERYYWSQRPMIVLEQAPKVRALAEEIGSASLLARKPHLAYYSGLEPLAYPNRITDFSDFLQFALDSETDLIAVGDQERAIGGETFILDFLDQARGISRLGEFNGLILYHLDRHAEMAGSRAEFAEIRDRIMVAEEAGNDDEVFLSRFDLGMGLMSLGQWDPARIQLSSCLKMGTSIPGICDVEDLDYLLVNLAFCHLNLTDSKGGLVLLGENLCNLTPTDDLYQTGLRNFVLGRLLMELKRTDEARELFQKAKSAYDEGGNDHAMKEAQLYLDHLAP